MIVEIKGVLSFLKVRLLFIFTAIKTEYMQSQSKKYIAFLRGINVGGHHKVPMADLRQELKNLAFENIITILNTGNIIFDSKSEDSENLEYTISEHLEGHFGFPVPTIVRKAKTILDLFNSDPFKDFELTKDIRFYISFLKNDKESEFEIPWTSPNESFNIIAKKDKNILSVLDLSVSKTPKAMEVLEKAFGKQNITTRNWNTVKRIEKKLRS